MSKADLTIMRLAEDAFRVVTGGASGRIDRKWLLDHLPDDGSAHLDDQTSAWSTLGLWGPRARDVLASTTEDDVSHEGFGFATCRWLDVGTVHVLASRISYVGELGWELYVPIEQGGRLWDTLWEAGQPHGVLPVGVGVYLTTGRLEKSYRAHGNELELEYDLVEGGMARPTRQGRRVRRSRGLRPAAVGRTGDDPVHAHGRRPDVVERRSHRYMLGREPILTRDGDPIEDARGRRSFVTSAGSGPSVGKHLLMSYLPPEHARVGNELAVEYFGDRYPVTVAVVGNTPLFDPTNERMKS